MSMIFLVPSTSAYSGGLLNGMTPTHYKGAGACSASGKNPQNSTDNNESTYGIVCYRGGYYQWALPKMANITSFRYKSSLNGTDPTINFLSNGVTVYSTGLINGTNTINRNISNVTHIRIKTSNSTGNYLYLYEFDVFGGYVLSPPTNVSVTALPGTAILQWSKVTDATGYFVYLNGVKLNTEPITGTTYTATNVPNNKTNSWQITAYNGAESAKSRAVTSYVNTMPDTPTLTVSVSQGAAVLSWTTSPLNDAYNVYRDGTLVASGIEGDTYTATGLADNVTYNWQVTATAAEFESEKSNTVKTVWDTIPPTKPTGLQANPKYNQVFLEWIANKATDGVAGYTIYRNGTKVNTVLITGTSYTVNAVAGVESTYHITASDAAGNESPASDSVTATALEPPDTTPPAAPTGLRATPREGYVSLGWNANSEPDVAGYIVYRNGIKQNTVPIKQPNFYSYGGTYGVQYRYEVTAIDKAGNESNRSEAVYASAIKPEDVTPPATPTGLTGALSADALSISLTWSANTEADLAGYNLYVSMDGIEYIKVNAEPLTDTSYSYGGITGNTRYYFKLSALDVNGNESKQTREMTLKTPSRVTNPDVDPTAPKLIITWQPVQGAIQYLIYYNDLLYAVVGPEVTQYEITLEDGYDPDAERQKVIVKAKFIDGSIGVDPPSGGGDRWGFQASDIFKNSMFLVGTFAGFILFGLIFRLTPRLIEIIKLAVQRRREARNL
jgi:Fibronectin type 3 domain-containing protein